ncbi:MAG: carboxypeptidase-like regulatory domain-containing protein, partial [Chitinophagaceae bacterium]|nr:carboxypeptidase-like regulatory domain-containing protein [Chitinophagaceae bacterium]
DSIYKGDAVVTVPEPATEAGADSFWVQKRTEPLTSVEQKVYENIDSLQNMRSFKRFMNMATLLLAGYSSFGPWELGPVNAFYSFNPIEGFRLRVGGRTTPKFNKNIYFENYVAYGFKDEKWKYYFAGTYSFNQKSIYSFPLNYVRASYQRDTKIPGQELQFVTEDNFLLSFKRGNNDKWLYNDIARLEYVHEFGKNMSYTFGYKYWKQSPAGSISYAKEVGGVLNPVQDVTTSELSAEFRWAPNEQFYQGKVYRIPFFNKYPIFRFRYIAGIKGLTGGQYNYSNISINIFKRFYLSQLGYADTWVEGGYLTGKVPFPLLTIHRANQTYAYQMNSYNLMNFMEFVSDRYASFNIDYALNGFVFNKIPLLKKLKLREAVSFKIMYGALRDENRPSKNPKDAFKFPTNDLGQTTTFVPDAEPYMEASVGVANIFKLFRVDLVKRLSYLNNPDVAKWGIRTRVRFDF